MTLAIALLLEQHYTLLLSLHIEVAVRVFIFAHCVYVSGKVDKIPKSQETGKSEKILKKNHSYQLTSACVRVTHSTVHQSHIIKHVMAS